MHALIAFQSGRCCSNNTNKINVYRRKIEDFRGGEWKVRSRAQKKTTSVRRRLGSREEKKIITPEELVMEHRHPFNTNT